MAAKTRKTQTSKAPKTKTEELLDSFTEAADRLGVEVRCERLQGIGGMPVAPGLARVDDEWVVFLEKRQSARLRLDTLIDALARFDLSQLELPEQAAAMAARAHAARREQ